MKSTASGFAIAATFAAGLFSLSLFAMPAQAATMKECAAQWKTMKAAKQTEGKTYRAFSKTCMGGSDSAKSDGAKSSDLAKEAGAGDVKKTAKAKKAEKADAKPEKKAKPSEGRAASAARQKECGADWKAAKAAGKVEKGMKWPQYWSACNTRKKGAAA